MSLIRLLFMVLLASQTKGTKRELAKAPPLTPSEPKLTVSFTKGIIAFEKLFSQLKRITPVIYADPKKAHSAKGTLLLLGPAAAAVHAKSAGRTVELFTSGIPRHPEHEQIAYVVSPQRWCTLFKKLAPKGKSGSLMLLTTPSQKEVSQALAATCEGMSLRTEVIVVSSTMDALARIGKLFKQPMPPWGIKLANDIDTLSPSVLELSLRLQYKRGVMLFVRTQHEVLAGGLCALEFQYTGTQIMSWLAGRDAQWGTKLYFNPNVARTLKINTNIFVTLGGRAKSW